MTVTVSGQKFVVNLEGDKATVNGKSYDVSVAEGGDAAPAASGGGGGGAGTPVAAPMPGAVFEIKKEVGDPVEEGETVHQAAMRELQEGRLPCSHAAVMLQQRSLTRSRGRRSRYRHGAHWCIHTDVH